MYHVASFASSTCIVIKCFTEVRSLPAMGTLIFSPSALGLEVARRSQYAVQTGTSLTL